MKIKKQLNERLSGLTYILTDDSIDADGDVIDLQTLNLNRFIRNPVALAYHDTNWEIGRWANIRFSGNKLLADLVPVDTNIESLINKGLLNGASIGFIIHNSSDMQETYVNDKRATILKNAEVVEASVVPIPANANALRVKALELYESGEIDEKLYNKYLELNKAGAVLNKQNKENLKKAMELIKEVLDSAETENEKNILTQILGGENGNN